MKIVPSKSGLSRGFAFITAADHAYTELNGIDFKSHCLTINDNLIKAKVTESSPSDNKTTAIKNYQTLLKMFQ